MHRILYPLSGWMSSNEDAQPDVQDLGEVEVRRQWPHDLAKLLVAGCVAASFVLVLSHDRPVIQTPPAAASQELAMATPGLSAIPTTPATRATKVRVEAAKTKPTEAKSVKKKRGKKRGKKARKRARRRPRR